MEIQVFLGFLVDLCCADMYLSATGPTLARGPTLATCPPLAMGPLTATGPPLATGPNIQIFTIFYEHVFDNIIKKHVHSTGPTLATGLNIQIFTIFKYSKYSQYPKGLIN